MLRWLMVCLISASCTNVGFAFDAERAKQEAGLPFGEWNVRASPRGGEAAVTAGSNPGAIAALSRGHNPGPLTRRPPLPPVHRPPNGPATWERTLTKGGGVIGLAAMIGLAIAAPVPTAIVIGAGAVLGAAAGYLAGRSVLAREGVPPGATKGRLLAESAAVGLVAGALPLATGLAMLGRAVGRALDRQGGGR